MKSCEHCRAARARYTNHHKLYFCGSRCRDHYSMATHCYRSYDSETVVVPVGAPILRLFSSSPELLDGKKLSELEHPKNPKRGFLLPRAVVQPVSDYLRIGPKRTLPAAPDEDEPEMGTGSVARATEPPLPMPASIDDLPDEVILRIMQGLDVQALINFMKTSTRFFQIGSDVSVMKRLSNADLFALEHSETGWLMQNMFEKIRDISTQADMKLIGRRIVQHRATVLMIMFIHYVLTPLPYAKQLLLSIASYPFETMDDGGILFVLQFPLLPVEEVNFSVRKVLLHSSYRVAHDGRHYRVLIFRSTARDCLLSMLIRQPKLDLTTKKLDSDVFASFLRASNLNVIYDALTALLYIYNPELDWLWNALMWSTRSISSMMLEFVRLVGRWRGRGNEMFDLRSVLEPPYITNLTEKIELVQVLAEWRSLTGLFADFSQMEVYDLFKYHYSIAMRDFLFRWRGPANQFFDLRNYEEMNDVFGMSGYDYALRREEPKDARMAALLAWRSPSGESLEEMKILEGLFIERDPELVVDVLIAFERLRDPVLYNDHFVYELLQFLFVFPSSAYRKKYINWIRITRRLPDLSQNGGERITSAFLDNRSLLAASDGLIACIARQPWKIADLAMFTIAVINELRRSSKRIRAQGFSQAMNILEALSEASDAVEYNEAISTLMENKSDEAIAQLRPLTLLRG